jgi:hypothetical protein
MIATTTPSEFPGSTLPVIVKTMDLPQLTPTHRPLLASLIFLYVDVAGRCCWELWLFMPFSVTPPANKLVHMVAFTDLRNSCANQIGINGWIALNSTYALAGRTEEDLRPIWMDSFLWI